MTWTRPLLIIVVFLLWTAFVITAFYVVQKPVTSEDGAASAEGLAAFQAPPSASALFASALHLLTAGLIGCAALLAGVRFTLAVSDSHIHSTADRAEFWIICAGFGFGLLALVTFALSLAAWLSLPVLAVLAALLIVVAGTPTLRRLQLDIPSLVRVRFPPLLWLFIVVSLTLALLAALSPPTAWDALVYHLTVPQRALLQGQLAPQGDIIPHENFPLLMSSLYLLAMRLDGDIAAQCLHWFYGLLSLGLIALSAYRFYGRGAVNYAVALALSMPMLLLLSAWAYNDVALAFYTLAAVYSFQRWREGWRALPLPAAIMPPCGAEGRGSKAAPASPDAGVKGELPARRAIYGWLTLAACMSGFAMGLKYTSFVLPLGLVGLLLWQLRRDALRPLLRFSLIAAIVAAPWYLKNLWFSGNPFYPFLLGGVSWDDMRTIWYARPGTGIGLDLATLLTLPLTVTLGFRDANFFDGRTGPLLLVTLPLLALNRRRLDPFLLLSALFGAFWVAGIVGSASLWQSRLLLPALLLLIPPLAHALDQLRRFDYPAFSLQRLLNLVIALVLAVTLLSQLIGFVQRNPLAFIIGAETRDQFVLRQTGPHAEAMAAVAALPASARVQFMWEPRSYLAGRTVRADPLLDALPHLIAKHGDLASGVRQLKAEGFTHVLVFEAGAVFAIQNQTDQFSPRDGEFLRQLESDYARAVFDNQNYRLLELR